MDLVGVAILGIRKIRGKGGAGPSGGKGTNGVVAHQPLDPFISSDLTGFGIGSGQKLVVNGLPLVTVKGNAQEDFVGGNAFGDITDARDHIIVETFIGVGAFTPKGGHGTGLGTAGTIKVVGHDDDLVNDFAKGGQIVKPFFNSGVGQNIEGDFTLLVLVLAALGKVFDKGGEVVAGDLAGEAHVLKVDVEAVKLFVVYHREDRVDGGGSVGL